MVKVVVVDGGKNQIFIKISDIQGPDRMHKWFPKEILKYIPYLREGSGKKLFLAVGEVHRSVSVYSGTHLTLTSQNASKSKNRVFWRFRCLSGV